MDTYPVELPDRRRRRRHSPEFRAAVIEACRQPGVSVAGVALANGLNEIHALSVQAEPKR